MACTGCRQPKEIRRPTIPRNSSNNIVSPNSVNRSNGNSSGNQRSRITGLTYVPK